MGFAPNVGRGSQRYFQRIIQKPVSQLFRHGNGIDFKIKPKL